MQKLKDLTSQTTRNLKILASQPSRAQMPGDGALGQFLAAVKAGSVERGSYLLVESPDRLSREEILPAHSLFLGIVQAGINLVTLVDKRVYRAKSTNLVAEPLAPFGILVGCEVVMNRHTV